MTDGPEVAVPEYLLPDIPALTLIEGGKSEGKSADKRGAAKLTGKHSKRGRLRLARREKGFRTQPFVEGGEDVLEDVFLNGDLLREHTLDEVRETVNAAS